MDLFFTAFASVILGFILGTLLTKQFGSAKNNSKATELAAAQATISELRTQLEDSKTRIENFEQRERDAASSESKFLQELRPLQAKLNEMQEKVVNAERERVDQFTQVQEQILESRRQQDALNKNTQALAGALSNNQVRGKWGELTLRRMLEQSGLRVGFDYEEQVNTVNDEGKEIIPDVIIKMPEGKFVAVDSKVPYTNFQRAFEIPEVADTTDQKRRTDLLKLHVSDVKRKIDELSKAEYFSGLPSSPEFTILFMPSESLLSVTLEHEPSILEYAFQRRIALVSPVSFFSVLKTVQYSWKQHAQEDVIKDLIKTGVELHNSVRILAEHAQNLGKQINGSVTHYNNFVSSLETTFLSSMRKLNEEHKKILDKGKTIPEVLNIEDTTKIFTKPELTADKEPEA